LDDLIHTARNPNGRVDRFNQAEAFRIRRLEGSYPYLLLDATSEKVREYRRLIQHGGVIAVGVRQLR